MARKDGIILHPPSANPLAQRPQAVAVPEFSAISAMPLSSSDISRIAALARLELGGTESERMLTQLNGFFDIVEKMRAVDTTGVEPLAHPVASIRDMTLRLRDDVVSEPDDRLANQRSAPATENGLFLVPRVIE